MYEIDEHDIMYWMIWTLKELNCLAKLFTKYSRDTEVIKVKLGEYENGELYIEFRYNDDEYDAYVINRGEELKVHDKNIDG